jgi:hypothetical protein
MKSPKSFLFFIIVYEFLSPLIRATCPAHLILFNFIDVMTLGEDQEVLRSSSCNFLLSFFYIFFLSF